MPKLVVLMLAVLVTGAVLAIIIKRKSRKKLEEYNEKTRLRNEANLLVSRYNRAVQEYEDVARQLAAKLDNTHDADARGKANELMTGFEAARNTVFDTLSSMNMDELDAGDIFDVNSRAESSIYDMEEAIKALRYIRPVRHEIEDEPFDYSKVSSTSVGFFSGCRTKDALKSRYRDLVRAFHPDSGHGDSDTLIKIKEEYEKELATYE